GAGPAHPQAGRPPRPGRAPAGPWPGDGVGPDGGAEPGPFGPLQPGRSQRADLGAGPRLLPADDRPGDRAGHRRPRRRARGVAVIPTASVEALAGLVAGHVLLGRPWTLLGGSASRPPQAAQRQVLTLARECLRLLG